MNNVCLEGPVQTGKSTLIRKVLKELFGPDLDGVSGFTSQRITDADGQLLGFRLAPAAAELSVGLDTFSARSIANVDNVFKYFTPAGPQVNMDVFETAGIEYMDEALSNAKAGRTHVILLDEIGGHELESAAFRTRLYELLDSDCLCAGVIKSAGNTRRMDPALIELNSQLHKKIFATDNRDDFERLLRNLIKSI